MATVQRMVNEAAAKAGFDNAIPEQTVTYVNNKMLLIGSSRNSPVIHAVLYINADSEFHAINTKEAVYEDAKEIGINARQFANYLGYIQESENDGYIRAYRAEDYYHINGRTQERAVPPDGFDDFGYVKDYEIGRRLREEAQKSGTVKKYDDSRNMELYDEEDDLFGAEYDADEIEDVFARHLWALTAIQSNTFFRVHQMHQIIFRYKTPLMNTPPGDRIENARRRRVD